MKKILRLTISNSDKFDTYEIRQSFKVKRVAPASPIKKPIEHVPSYDSGVGGSNESSCAEECYDHCRDRSLSRISESPENGLTGSSELVEPKVPDTRRLSINNQTVNLHSDIHYDHVNIVDTKIHRTVKPPQFLDIPSITNETSYISRSTYTEQHSSCTTVYENLPSPYIRASTPGQMQTHEVATPQQNSAICAEPIVVDCDNKSEYFRLVVRRTVRDCSDSDDSEQDGRDSTIGLSATNKYFKSSKHKSKSKAKMGSNDLGDIHLGEDNEQVEAAVKTPDGLPKLFVSQNFRPSSIHRETPTERSPRLQRSNHQRSPSGISNCSVGLTLDNDDIQFEITNTHRSSKRMSKLVHLGHASLPRRSKKLSKKSVDGSDEADVDSSDEVNSTKEKAAPSNLVKDIWDGTIRRLRSGTSKLLRHERNNSVQSTNSKLRRQLSHSLSDISQSSEPTVAVIHKRSRSALAENELYVTPNHSTPTANTDQLTSVKILDNSQRSSLELQLDVKALPVGNSPSPRLRHFFKASQQKRIRLSSWSHTADDDTECTDNKLPSNNNHGVSTPSEDHQKFQPQNGVSRTKPQPVVEPTMISNRPVHFRSSSNPYTSLDMEAYPEVERRLKNATVPNQYRASSFATNTAADTVNDVMLPVKLRLPGGQEQELLLTKQDIYGNQHKPKKKHKSVDVTVRRKRSMSQPNLYARHLVR